MTSQHRAPSGQFSVILPGTWAVVPMDDRERLRQRVSAVVKQQMPKNDRLARQRKMARDEILATAEEAADAGADIFALALEILPGVPFGASLIAFEQEWPPEAPASVDGEFGRLARAVPGSVPVAGDDSVYVRRASMGTGEVGDTEFSSLSLEYWFPMPDGRLLCFLISVPLCQNEELFTAFFDAVADSVRWATPAELSS